jgi:hypothetical protein
MSCCGKDQNFCVGAGATFHPIIRWGTDVLISRPITAITQAAPAVVTAPTHLVPAGWEVAVVSAKGMTQINATRYPPAGDDWTPASVVDGNTVALIDINSSDMTTYSSGGFLVYSTPGLVAGMTATMTFWDTPTKDDTPLLTLTSSAGITLDFTLMTITPKIATAGLTWATAYYDLDVTDTGGIITQVMSGVLTID